MSRVLAGMPWPTRMRISLLALCATSWVGCSQPQLTKLPVPFLSKPQPTLEQRYSLARMFEESRPEEARKIYLELAEKHPDNQPVLHRLAVLAASEGKYPEADHYFGQAAQAGPADADLLCDMGYTLYLQHRLPEAETVLRQALAQKPRHPKAINNLAIVLGQMGRYEESFGLFRQVNQDAEAEANLGYVLAQQGEVDEAKHHLNRALTLDPKLESAAEAMIQLKQREQMAQADRKSKGLPTSHEEPDEIWIDPSGMVPGAPTTMQATAIPPATQLPGTLIPVGVSGGPSTGVQQATMVAPMPVVQPSMASPTPNTQVRITAIR